MHSRQLAIQIRFAAAIICTLSQCSTFTTWQHELYSWNVISRVEAKIAKMKGPAKRHQLSISAQISYFSSLLLIQHINSNNFLKFLSVIRIFQQCRLHKLSVIVWSTTIWTTPLYCHYSHHLVFFHGGEKPKTIFQLSSLSGRVDSVIRQWKTVPHFQNKQMNFLQCCKSRIQVAAVHQWLKIHTYVTCRS